MMKKVFTNCTIYSGKEILSGIAILTDGGRISGLVYDNDIPEDYRQYDLKGNNIAPAFFDLQIYGGNGHLFSENTSVESINAIHEYCVQGGAANFLLTISTNTAEVVSKGISVVKEYLNEGGKGLPGLHLEGPWMNPEKRGAHLLECIHQPTLDEAKKLVDEAEGAIKIITLAPEVTDETIIDFLQTNNIIVSAGHTNATFKQATDSFKKIKIVTHLFNAMSQFQSREPGMVGAIYDHSSVKASIVADGVHVDFAAIRISKNILGDRLFLITDAVAETKNGPYRHVFKNDRYVLPDGTLSGSALTMMKAVKNCVQHAGIDLAEALRMASLYPAKILGKENEFGLIEKNYKASFVVFDKELNTVEVIDLS
jgi:N-acetylglucosamine-6-phosphate deacetylase